MNLKDFDCKTIEGRNKAQNAIRAVLFTVLDLASGELTKEEHELWKETLWNFSDKCEEFYKNKHNLYVWNH